MKFRALTLIVLLLTVSCWADPTVLRLLNEGRSKEEKLSAEHLRIVHPETFPDTVVVGTGDEKRPYILARVIVGERSMVPRKAAGELLRQQGWAEGDADQREALAQAWLNEVMWSFGEAPLVEKDGYAFGRSGVPRFKEPRWYQFPDGAFRYIAWIQQPQRAEVSVTFRQMLYHFSVDGDLILVKQLDRVVLAPGQ